VGLGQRGVRLDHALHHQGTIPDGWLHALAEIEGHVHGHHVVVDGVLVDQQNLDAGPGCLDRGGHAGGTGADDDHGDVAFGRGAFSAMDRLSIVTASPGRQSRRQRRSSKSIRPARASRAAYRRSDSRQAPRDRRRDTAVHHELADALPAAGESPNPTLDMVARMTLSGPRAGR